MKGRPVKRNPYAHSLRAPIFRMRKVRPLKGKGSYRRHTKHRSGVDSLFGRFIRGIDSWLSDLSLDFGYI